MFRFVYLSFIISACLSLSSTSLVGKSLKRRQADSQSCRAIDGFECRCSYYRATCTTERDLPAQINVADEEKGKYQSVELVIMAQRDVHVNDRTFEPVKLLFKSEVDNLEFRVKFEKFTSLHLSSPGIFNRIFPESISDNVRKHVALEIYNPEVPPQDNKHLFENLKTDSLELYALYPFHGTFQELFNGANIKYLRLSGGEIRSDLNQPFTGNIARLELAKQASSLSAQNFPVYPAHELIINAFYITEFQSEHPPNYDNLGELRVHSQERIPANAFRDFPNIHTLSISTAQDIDPQALNGLSRLEKLIIKDTLPSINLINTVPQIKELEATIEKLDQTTQCLLLEKLAEGKLAVQALPNGRQCTCLSAFLDHASGRSPCDAQNCDQSQCSAIANNFDTETQRFKALPVIYRADGTDAFRPRDIKLYPAPYHVTYDDKVKLERAMPSTRPSHQDQSQHQPAPSDHAQPPSDQQPNDDQNEENPDMDDGKPATDDQDQQTKDMDPEKTSPENESASNEDQSSKSDDGSAEKKKGFNWLPLIIAAASIIGLILLGVIFLVIKRKQANSKGKYDPAPNNEPPSSQSQ